VDVLERIDRRLADTRARINPHDFEDCATSMLSAIYPGLVPIVGGTDHGLDAEIMSTDTPTIGVIITSARTLKGVRASLRASLTSLRSHDLPERHIIVANLAEMNRRRRDGLSSLAAEFDCKLVQVFDRAFFTNQFRVEPDWRLKILGIAGGAFCLSREPRGSRPDDRFLPSVGRDELLDVLEHDDRDAVLCGVPGSGKSHVAARLGGALFLEDRPSPERLLDDLLAAKPPVVIVDDAGERLDELDRLLHARRSENLRLRIVATCWPHQVDHVLDHLSDAERYDVDLLTREEMGALLQSRGITNLGVRTHILAQAQGRPAWALNLADLLIRGGNWEAVWNGSAARSQIATYLRRSAATPAAIELLTSIAMLGEVADDQLRELGRLLEIPRVDLRHTVNSIAVAGLLDVVPVPSWRRVADPDEGLGVRHRVEPDLVAGSIVSDAYFSGRPAALSLGELRSAFPDKRTRLVQMQVLGCLLGATHPVVPTNAEILDALTSIESTAAEDELLRTYALIGQQEALFVANLLDSRSRGAWAAGDTRMTDRHVRVLAERIADMFDREVPRAVIAQFLRLVGDLAEMGFDYPKVIGALVENLRDAHSGDLPNVTHLLELAASLAQIDGDLADTVPAAVRLSVVIEVMTPTFDGNYMHPEKVRQFVLQTFTWSGADLTALAEAVRPVMEVVVPLCPDEEVERLLALLEKWIRLARGHKFGYGGSPVASQVESASRIARQLADLIQQAVRGPGRRARFNAVARELGVHLEEPDKLFACLTTERDIELDWQEAMRRADEELDAVLQQYRQSAPAVLMKWIRDNEEELGIAREGRQPVWRVMRKVAEETEITDWLNACTAHGLIAHAGPLLEAAVEQGGLAPRTIADAMANPTSRQTLIPAVLRRELADSTVTEVLDQLAVDDMTGFDIGWAIRHAPEQTLRRLLTHEDLAVRGAAAALWAADVTVDASGDDERSPERSPQWLEAITHFTVPSTLETYYERQALAFVARRVPDTFIDLAVRHADDVSRRGMDAWDEGVRQLTAEHRHELWTKVAHTRHAREWFWVAAAGDVEWVEAAFDRRTVPMPPDQILRASRCQNGCGIAFEEIARVFMRLDVEPDAVLWLLDAGTRWGEDHERHARDLDRCRALAASPESDLARLGARGVELIEPRLAAARKRARDAEVRGLMI
jgi:hypothetical protein